MTRDEVVASLGAYVEKYVAEQLDFPNTEVALLDDFGAWLLQFQDDDEDDLQGCAQGD